MGAGQNQRAHDGDAHRSSAWASDSTYQSSGEFGSPELLRIFPRAGSENAHNNFLQILAELGLVGFAIDRLAARARGHACEGVPARRSRRSPSLGNRGGLAAFVLTWLAGHPLLLDEPAFTFWVMLGAAAGVAGPRRAGVRGRFAG